MTINFEKTFGKPAASALSNKREDLPKAQFWLNVGYTVKGANDDGTDRFVSIPVGIPLDTQEHLPVNSSNDDFAAFRSAQNNLLDQIMVAAQQLEAGEETNLNLEIQLRRVKGEREPVSNETNKFVVPINLVG